MNEHVLSYHRTHPYHFPTGLLHLERLFSLKIA
jgi:hypothetical protein